MKMSLEILDTISPPQEPTSVRHCHHKEVKLDGGFSILHIALTTCTI